MDALGKLGDHLLGDVEAIGLVEPAKMIDGDEEEPARGAKAHGFVEDAAEQLDEPRAVCLAGERIELRELDQLAFALVPRVDGADDAVRAGRLAVRAGEPAANVLDPDLAAVVLPEGVFDLIGDAGAVVGRLALRHRIEAGLSRVGFDLLRINTATGDVRHAGNAKDGGGVFAPGERIAVETPFVGGLANGRENPGRIRRTRHLVDADHDCPLLGTPRGWSALIKT